MAVYLDHHVQTPQNVDVLHELINWHNAYPVLAVASFNEATGSEVNLFYEEGERTSDSPVKKANAHVTALQWHPLKKLLAVGWSTGEITFWNVDERVDPTTTAISPDNTTIRCLQWSSEGSRICIADASGWALLYKLDANDNLSLPPFSKTKVKEPINVMILKPATSHGGAISLRTTSTTPAELQVDTLDAMDAFAISRENNRPVITLAESCTFFLGGESGGVYCIRESGLLQDSFTQEKAVVKLLYYKEGSFLLTILEDLTLCQHYVGPDCTLQQILKVKLSGKPHKIDFAWAGTGVLAVATSESMVRLWEIETQDNYILSLDPSKGFTAGDNITCLAYSDHRSMLAAGTQLGHVTMWKRTGKASGAGSSDHWRLQAPCLLQGAINKLEWSPSHGFLAVCTTKDVFILREQAMCGCFKEEMVLTQINQNFLSVYNVAKIHQFEIKLNLQPKGIHCTAQNVIAWDGRSLSVLEITDTGNYVTVGTLSFLVIQTGTFQTSTTVAAISGQSIYVMEPGKLQVRTFQGTVKQLISLAEEEDDPCCLDILGNFLCVGTTSGFLRIFDLSRRYGCRMGGMVSLNREAKPLFHPKYIAEGMKDFAIINSVRVNSAGNRVACTIKKKNNTVDPKLYIWDAENDAVLYFNFQSGLGDQEDFEKPKADAGEKSGQKEPRLLHDVRNRLPSHFEWDSSDARYLVCDAAKLSLARVVGDNRGELHEASPEIIVASFFVTADHGVLIQDSFHLSPFCDKLLGVSLPYIYFSKKPEYSIGESAFPNEGLSNLETALSKYIVRRICRDFIGLEQADKATKEAMTNFSFYLTIGNLDEAFKAVKLIKSESVWENMAQMCVKTQRVDVATICLGNMRHVRGIRALREAQAKYPEPEAHLGILAIQLNMVEDAERLFISCKRFDLLNELYQMTNNWKKAIDVATTLDRVHLRNTHYAYAKHLETVGALQGAIDCYEKSDTHRFEVPRMLFDNPQFLETYVKKTDDGYLRKWWAQYLESLGDIDAALQFYAAAGDHFSVVRLHCYINNFDKAAEIANQTSNQAACYHLARQYETTKQYKEAVHFFAKAHAYGSAIRLCKSHGMEDQIAQLALMSTESDMIEAAKFYENKPGKADKAVMLYHKAGMLGRALELAFRTEQFSAMDLMASDLNENSDPRTLERCADFFLKNQQYTKAVQLLAYAKKFKEAIELCSNRNVPITEQLVEQLTPTREDIPEALSRNRLLEMLADCCMEQGLYHYAAKKFTQAGGKIQAMRALLKSGDTDKIVFFANTARTKEIYIMAANYLQTVDWKSNADLIKSIITFYTKAQAPEHLASFYDACAQAEIDEYRDYAKALDAINEAVRCTAQISGKDASQAEERSAEYNSKIAMIKKFLEIRSHYETNANEAIKQLQDLAKQKDVNEAVRLGDIYAVLVIHNVKRSNFKKAYQFMEELRTKMPKLNIASYIKPEMIATIHKELNLPLPKSALDEDTAIDKDQIHEAASLQRKIKLSANEDV